MWVTSSLTTVKTPTSVALGNFDGVHQGHRRVLEPILNPSPPLLEGGQANAAAQQDSLSAQGKTGVRFEGARSPRNFAPNSPHTYASVVTFNPHPQEFFSGQPRALLTPHAEKVKYLEAMGVEQLVLLPFDRTLANLSPQEFVEKILVRQLMARRISVGEDFRFGRSRSGGSADLTAIASSFGVEVCIAPEQKSEQKRIGSSAIRQALELGNIREASQQLGRPYTLVGPVVRGQQLGRTLGFPTANLQLPPNKFLPRYGVYAVRASWGDTTTPQKALGVINIGCRPTVDGNGLPTIEVHLLDWSGDLYGETIIASLEQFLRPEQKFASLSELKAQIQADCTIARKLLAGKN